MKRKALTLSLRFLPLLVLILVLSVPLTAYADDTEVILKQSGADALVDENSPSTAEGFKLKTISILKDSLQAALGSLLSAFSKICTCLLLIAVMNSFKSIQADSSLDSAFDFLSAAVLTCVSFPVLLSVFNSARTAIENLSLFGSALMPIMASLYALGGNTATAVTANSSFAVLLTVTEIISSKVLIPFLQLGFGFTLAGALPSSERLGSITSFIKNALCILIAFIFSLIGFIFYFQSSITAVADNYAYRGLKFASATFIPIIGNMLGESARTVFGAVSVVKSSTGAVGVATMLAYILPSVIMTVLYKLMFLLCSALARLAGLEKESRFFAEMNALLSVVMALLIGCSALFVVLIAVFIKSGVTV